MIETLRYELERIAERQATRRRHGALAIFWTALFLVTAALIGLHFAGLDVMWPAVGVLAAAGLGWGAIRIFGTRPADLREVARSVEAAHPELRTALLAAIDQKPGETGYSYLQSRVIEKALNSAQLNPWDDVTPARSVRWRGWLQRVLGGLTALLLLSLLTLEITDRLAAARVAHMLRVTPGNAEIERGEPVTFTAEFDGEPPASATLSLREENGKTREIPLERTLDDPLFAASLPAVTSNLRYRVVFDHAESEEYQLTVYDPPRVERLDATLDFPDYTGRPDEAVEDTRRVTAIEQTEVTVAVRTNKPMQRVELRSEDGSTMELKPDANDDRLHTATITAAKSGKFAVALADPEGHEAVLPNRLELTVRENKPPVVTAKLPTEGDRVTPLQEVKVEAKVQDDFGLKASGISIQVPGGKSFEIAGPGGGPEVRDAMLQQLVKLEEVGATPNDLIVWNAWAEDIGPDGKVRRTNGDLHLVPVRHFDEIKRQEEGVESQAGESRCLQCIRIQTEIMNGTWATQRESAPDKPALDEIKTLRESQQVNLELAQTLREDFQDPAARQHLVSAEKEMEAAIGHLQEESIDLSSAVSAEQRALAHLYRLLSAEQILALGRQSMPMAGSPPIDDLELKDLKPRYQNETWGQDELDEKARAIRETLARLTDLAKRQTDLNEEINRMIQGLRVVKNDEERAELERRLQRLRDQQRELLDDMDRARQRMGETARETQTGGREEEMLEKARESARRTAEKLDAGKLGEALAEGTRTQRELDRAHEEFQRSSAGALSEQLRELRQQARELAENQANLEKQLADTRGPLTKRSLREDDTSLAAKARQQAEALEKLMQSIEATATLAEESEPLVARRLEAAGREAKPGAIQNALENLEAAVTVDARAEALAANEMARRGIDNLRERIEKATAQVLGSETEALEYAQAEVDALRQSLMSWSNQQSSQNASAEPQSPSSQNELTSDSDDRQSRESQEQQPGSGAGRSPNSQPGSQPAQVSGPQSGQGQGQQQAEQGPGSARTATVADTSAGGLGSIGGGSTTEGPTVIESNDYQKWADRLQDLEAVVDVPEVRDALARARSAAREARMNWKRHSERPGAEFVHEKILRPLLEASAGIKQALNERDRREPLAPVERDPVPEAYAEVVQKYYESLSQ